MMTYYCCGYWVTGTLWWPSRCRYCGKHMHTVEEASGSARRAAAADFGTDAGHYAGTPPSPPTTSARAVPTTAQWRAAPPNEQHRIAAGRGDGPQSEVREQASGGHE